MDLSIIIINFNTPVLTKQTVDSILSSTRQIAYEIIIVDNSTHPDQVFPYDDLANVRVIRGVENKGFGHACNLGFRHAAGDYILFLNSDTIVHQGTLETCVSYLGNHSEVGALGVRTLLADGTLDHGCKRGFPTPSAAFYYFTGMDKKHPENPKYGVYRQTFINERQVSEVDAVSGAFLMVPGAVLRQTGGFDEAFFMYGEDLDLCYRIKQAGFSVVYFGEAAITHLKGQSGLHKQSKTVIYHFYHAMILFYRKHYHKRYSVLTSMAVYSAIWLKYGLTLLKMRAGRK